MKYQSRKRLKRTITYLRERNHNLAMEGRPTSYELELLKRYKKALDKLWAAHSKPVDHKQPGDYDYGQMWWCSKCRTQWPCEVANAVLVANGSPKLGPLRAPIVGETIIRDGVVSPSPGSSMSVQGLVVPKVKEQR